MRPFPAIILLFIAGCSSATQSGSNTALDSTDLVTMTNDMAARIEASPAVQKAIADHGPLKIVVEKVVNEMRAEVLPAGPAEEFTARVRTLIAQHEPDRFQWILNLDTFRDLRKRQLDSLNLGPPPGEVSPEYVLTATFTSLADENGSGRTDYYVCNYSLAGIKDRSVLWTHSYEVKKRAVKGFLD
jgi:hypothetical protein